MILENRPMSEAMSANSSNVRFISATKWKKFMVSTLKDMKQQFPEKINFIQDLTTIVSSIPQEKMVAATLTIRPFKPQFIEAQSFLLDHESTMAETVTKNVKQTPANSKKTENGVSSRLSEKTLLKDFNQRDHPYKFILKNLAHFLELKAKNKSNIGKSIQKIKSQLRKQLNILAIFLQKVSQPYYVLFQISHFEEMGLLEKKFKRFISQFITQSEILTKSIRKILRYHCKNLYEKASEKLENFPDPKNYDLTEDFEIDGCYIRSINSLMEFAEEENPINLMKKLKEFRKNILLDIDAYYEEIEQSPKQLELNAQSQLEIIRFIVVKLKIWSWQIYAGLKFLQIIFGQDQIGYKYDDVSFMYTQLSIVFEILQF